MNFFQKTLATSFGTSIVVVLFFARLPFIAGGGVLLDEKERQKS
jgi:hypothetical protein